MFRVAPEEIWTPEENRRDITDRALLLESCSQPYVNLCTLASAHDASKSATLAKGVLSTLRPSIKEINQSCVDRDGTMHRYAPGLLARLNAAFGYLTTLIKASTGELTYIQDREHLFALTEKALSQSGDAYDRARTKILEGNAYFFPVALTTVRYPERPFNNEPDIDRAQKAFSDAADLLKASTGPSRFDTSYLLPLAADLGLIRCATILGDKQSVQKILMQLSNQRQMLDFDAATYMQACCSHKPEEIKEGFVAPMSQVIADELRFNQPENLLKITPPNHISSEQTDVSRRLLRLLADPMR